VQITFIPFLYQERIGEVSAAKDKNLELRKFFASNFVP
jgi:hypothetical protein